MKFRTIINYNSSIIESGESASKVIWSNENGAKVGRFSVIGIKSKNSAEFTIVITKLRLCKSLKILNFKFYDPNGNIEVSSLMDFHLGVGPTIKKEFENIMKSSPECIVFSADKHEKSRVKLYDKFSAKIATKFNYEIFYKTAITSDEDEYALVRKDKINDFKKCYNVEG